MPSKFRKILLLLFGAAVLSCLLFLFWGINAGNYAFNIPRRAVKLAAFICTGSAIGLSTIIFQTITHNRILTPGIIGLDSLYMFIQTFIVFLAGGGQLARLSGIGDFILSVVLMIFFSIILFKVIFRAGNERKLFVVMLAGIVCGNFFGSLSTFMQVAIDPNEFLLVQDRMFASFNSVNHSLLGIAAVVIGMAFSYGYSRTAQLDIISLGRDIAIDLGIAYDQAVRRQMILISVMVAVSTALVGPVTFLGLLTANLSRQLLPTYRHEIIIAGAALISVIALVFGQFIVERILTFTTTISVIINFAAGIYFIYLLTREGKL